MVANAKSALDALKTAFPGRVTTRDAAAEYDAAAAVPWSRLCWTKASGYVKLTSAQEVAGALGIISKTGCRFAIRTSGHNPNVGFNSTDETGVVLDLRGLQSKELGNDKVARLGAGNTWGDVYPWIEEHGLSVIGGRDKQVGVSGFLLGGGLGGLPNIHGLGADGVKNFEVVLADGQLVNANSKENPDLFWALKGGCSNFGIVTRFDLATHPLIKVNWNVNLYKSDDHAAIIKATAAVQKAAESDPKIALFTNFNAGFVAVGLFYADWIDKRPDSFKPFYDLNSAIMTVAPPTNGTFLSLAKVMENAHSEEPKKRYIGTITTKPSEELYSDAYEAWQEACKGIPEGATLHYTIQPVGSAAVEAGEGQGGNSLGLQKVSQVWWVFTCEWPTHCDDTLAQNAVDFMVQTMQEKAREKGSLLEFLSPSFATGSQKVLASYGADNLRRLRETAARYDPQGLFQKLQNNGFLLRDDI